MSLSEHVCSRFSDLFHPAFQLVHSRYSFRSHEKSIEARKAGLHLTVLGRQGCTCLAYIGLKGLPALIKASYGLLPEGVCCCFLDGKHNADPLSSAHNGSCLPSTLVQSAAIRLLSHDLGCQDSAATGTGKPLEGSESPLHTVRTSSCGSLRKEAKWSQWCLSGPVSFFEASGIPFAATGAFISGPLR